ncbi:hypothetical protein RFI_20989 [Reticulomyxa filosa]|uniref:Uncharacterized protein n=1 Tax=Reticulomyxa filosa TaxID=46433 RepID=X6MTF3_RETFI|nr:hypothetical protein RFI_20989 [Reticulomyxa filosa]|eukprot:ETO16365.1 hypothetical protein RFI_20989 [Reticulomyxa filosa]
MLILNFYTEKEFSSIIFCTILSHAQSKKILSLEHCLDVTDKQNMISLFVDCDNSRLFFFLNTLILENLDKSPLVFHFQYNMVRLPTSFSFYFFLYLLIACYSKKNKNDGSILFLMYAIAVLCCGRQFLTGSFVIYFFDFPNFLID